MMILVHGPARVNSLKGTDSDVSQVHDLKDAARRRHEVRERILADPRLSPTDKLVALALDRYDFKGTGRVWPTMATLGAKVGRGVEAIRMAIRSLEFHGFLSVARRAYEGGLNRFHGGNIYLLRWKLKDSSGGPWGGPGRPEGEASPRQRESARVKAGRAAKIAGPAVGADPWNSMMARVGNSHDESPEPESPKEIRGTDGSFDEGGGKRETASQEPEPKVPSLRRRIEGIGPGTTEAEAKELAKDLAADLDGSSGRRRPKFLPAFQAAIRDASNGRGLTIKGLAWAYGLAKEPKAQNPGAVFLAAVRRCRDAGGDPPRSSRPGTGQAPAVPLPPPFRREPLKNRAQVIGAARQAINARRLEGADAERNRAISRMKAAEMADGHGLKPEDRASLLEWIEEALAVELDGGPDPLGSEIFHEWRGRRRAGWNPTDHTRNRGGI